MLDKNLYEYATIRLVPMVEREEFINIGILLFCKSKRYLQIKWHLDESRVQCLAPYLDIAIVRLQLESMENIAHASKNGGPISLLDTPSRFRWLTATRSSIIQVSKIHPGFCDELDQTLEKLFTELVLLLKM